MKIHLFLILITFTLFNKVNAQSMNYDIYGVDVGTQEKIISCCEQQIKEYIRFHKTFNLKKPGEATLKKELALQKALLTKINKVGSFGFSKLSSIYYPLLKDDYLTIDLVKKSESNRIPISPKRTIKKNISKPTELKQIFKLWNDYLEENLKLIYTQKTIKQKPCPVMHCIYGFDEQETKHTLLPLKKGTEKYKKNLMDIIAHSDNEKERETAIFILAHHNDPKEITHFLIQYSDDANPGVRNNAMRVLALALMKHDVPNLDINRIIQALNYPNVTDRNKAAFVLFSLAIKNDQYHSVITQRAGPTLIKLLRLKQPNNHDIAHNILQTISRKKFADTDIKSWNKWIDTQMKPSNIA